MMDSRGHIRHRAGRLRHNPAIDDFRHPGRIKVRRGKTPPKFQIQYPTPAGLKCQYVATGTPRGPRIAASQATSVLEERKAVFVKLQKLILDQALVQTQMFITNLFVSTKKVNGFEVDLVANPRWQGVWLA